MPPHTLHAAAQAQHQVQRALLLDIVVSQRAAVLQLLASKDQALLVGRDACAHRQRTAQHLLHRKPACSLSRIHSS